MLQRRFGLLFLVPIFLLSVRANAFADCRAKINLNVGPAGLGLDVSGTAEKRAQGTQQRFKVSMDARVPNGTTYNVFVFSPTSAANGSPAGSIIITLGAGELSLDNNNGATLPTGVDPVCNIGRVEVRNGAGGVVLSGNF